MYVRCLCMYASVYLACFLASYGCFTYLSIYLFPYISIYQSEFLSMFTSIYVWTTEQCSSFCISVHIYIYIYICVCVCVCVCLSIYLNVFSYTYLFIGLRFFIFVYMLVCMNICKTVILPVTYAVVIARMNLSWRFTGIFNRFKGMCFYKEVTAFTYVSVSLSTYICGCIYLSIWDCRIYQLLLCRGEGSTPNECPDITLNNLMVMFQYC